MAAVASESESAVDARALARTYNNPVYDDAWESVQDYYAAMEFTTEYQSPSPTAVARELDIPRRRVRVWYDGSKPDAVRGLEVARQHGWLPVTTDERVFRGLNALVAWNYSGGSITTDTYVPLWTAHTGDDRAFLDRAAEFANTILDFTRTTNDSKTVELRPVTDASVLGRVLVVLGVPTGPKHDGRRLELPLYLDDAPTRVRQEWIQIYVHNRGQPRSDSALIQFHEDRAAGYLRSLAGFIESVTGESVTVSGQNVTVSAAAARVVEGWDPPLDASVLEDG